MLYMAYQHRDGELQRAELWQMTLCRDHLDDGLPAEILVDILGHRDRHGQVLGALDDMARYSHALEEVPQVEREYHPEHAQRYIRPHAEQRPAELLHRH